MARDRQELTLDRAPNSQPPAGAHTDMDQCVLIVVDDRLVGRQLARMLIDKGYEDVRAVSRADRALISAQEFEPAIIFLDVALSDDAYDLARDLRRQAGSETPRIIALTSSIEHSTRERARDAGFERWLLTPVVQSELDSVI